MSNKYILLLRQITKTFDVHDLVMDILWKCKNLKSETEYLKFKIKPEFSEQITATILTSSNSRLFNECLKSVQMQSLPPQQINIIRDVTPFSKASQNALDSVNTQFYISVDDDMVLRKDCFKRLIFYLSRENNCAEVVLRLKDQLLDRIYGIHIYRTEIIRKIGFHPLLEEKGSERFLYHKLKERGYISKHIDLVMGYHNPSYTPEEAFWKYRFIGEQYIYYRKTSGNEILRRSINRLCEYWIESNSKIVLYAMAGLIDGIQSENPSEQLNYNNRDNDLAFQKINTILSSKTIAGQLE